MKYMLALAAIATTLFAVPAFADDGDVPKSTLTILGLGDLEVLSEAQGMQIRGMASDSFAMSASNIAGLLIAPDTKSFLFGLDANSAVATAENAGKHTVARVQTGSNSGLGLNLNVSYPGFNFNGFLIGGAGGGAAAFGG